MRRWFEPRRTTPLILQGEVNECGLACLAMVASHHGKQVDIVALRSRFRLSAAGASAQHLLAAATELDLQGRALKLELADLSRLKLPLVLHWDLTHFVVLSRLRSRRCTILDPALGKREYTHAELGLHFTGIAIELLPAPDFRMAVLTPRLSLRQLLPASPAFYRAVGQVFVLSLLLQLLALTAPLYLQLVIDQGLGKGDMTLIAFLALLFLLVVLGRVALSYVRGVVSMQLSNQLGFQLLGHTFRHLLRLPLGFFERREMGDIVSRFSALENIKQLLTQEMITVVVDGLFSSLSLLLLFLYSPLLAAIAFGVMAIFLVLRLLSLPLEKNRRQETLVTAARQQSRFMESVRSISTTKLYHLETQRVSDWQDTYAGYLNSGYRLGHLQLSLASVQSLLFGLDNLLTIFLGAQLVHAGQLTLGQLMSFLFLKQHFTNSVTAMLPKLTELGLMRLELERVSDITSQQPEAEPPVQTLLRRTLRGSIHIRSLNFRYADTDRWILRNFSAEIPAGSSAAVTGPSGCGKSTLLKLVLGLEKPQSGELTIDGLPLAQFGAAQLRRQAAVILHNEGLLAGDLAYNIRLGYAVDDHARLRHACELAGVLALVESLPLGFSTPVGEMGTVFSAGQVQRLLLARAFYRAPALLILDEALSHLGHIAARDMFNTMREQRITILLVTHNPGLAELADQQIRLSVAATSGEHETDKEYSP